MLTDQALETRRNGSLYGFFTHLQLPQSPFFTKTMPRLYT
jgi:hypothetical protein